MYIKHYFYFMKYIDREDPAKIRLWILRYIDIIDKSMYIQDLILGHESRSKDFFLNCRHICKGA